MQNSCGAQSNALGTQFSLVTAEESGIEFRHTDGGSGDRYVVETVIGSLALFDYDLDGLVDVYFINCTPLPKAKKNTDHRAAATPTPGNRLYRNLGNWKFADVTQSSGLGEQSYGMGVVVGDVDEDGDADVFLSNFGRDRFYLNQGDGTFVEASEAFGFGPRRDSARAMCCSIWIVTAISISTQRLMCSSITRNIERGPSRAKSFIRGQTIMRPLPIFCIAITAMVRSRMFPRMRESMEFDRRVWEHYRRISMTMAISICLLPMINKPTFFGSTKVESLRIKHCWREWLLIATAKQRQHGGRVCRYQWRRATRSALDDLSRRDAGVLRSPRCSTICRFDNVARIDPTLNPHVKWGINANDFDNDGDNDLFIACGHFLDNVRFIDDRTDVKVQSFLLANNGRGVFRNVTATSGDAMRVVESSRGSAVDDLDNDGDLDLVVLNVNSRPTVARNELASKQVVGINVRLIGTVGNRDAVGVA